ncbi:MAG TPA: LPS export ABC transporter periplasmic protein LptC [Bacteroidia bacterium]|jgi:LPS export ABC transporter protein LptC|nr:LPS export ABC transporter periplasmic protein LptC [Bacteroidia bacterium]
MKQFLNRFYILIVLIIGISGCENDIATINSLSAADELPIESGKNVEYIYSDSAIVRAKLTAPRLDRYGGKKNYMELPQGMHIIFYNEEKEEQTNLTADYGIGYDDGNGMNKMEAKRNVVVINEKGERLNTEHLIWDAVTKQIYTDEFVKITTKEETIWGDGLKADQDFSKYEILHPKGSIAVNDEEATTKKEEQK